MKSWKTTATGVVTILTAVLSAAKQALAGNLAGIDWGTTIAAVTAGFGLIFARDNTVTSEQAGAK